MKAVVFHKIGDIRLEDVPEPKIKEPTDAICAHHGQCDLWHRPAYDSGVHDGSLVRFWDMKGWVS
jgi:hypothetical protein